ncbi:hypothetical protein [Bacillus thuringiensis]|uniref:Uncharacterized protein n=1 Tax=Bacillus thuringiensis TaxID=1428 RepID=A0A9X6WID3_BACTU|nr:hypothetical protein [Bacillus thuringiensis]PFJ33195.1 hypothetical protein COJ15_28550 [Bacillus thuringiensis]
MLHATVFHGRKNHNELRENIVFFSSNEEFSKDYGDVKTYKLTFKNPFHTCSEKDVTHLLSQLSVLVDSYDDSEYRNYEELENAGLLYSDTWELFEPYMNQIKRLGYDGMIIYEGGVENYVSFSLNQYRLVNNQ